MKNRIASKILKTLLLLLCTITGVSAQQTIIEYNSDSELNGGTKGPHLLLMETGDSGNGQLPNQDGWARLWFKNAEDTGDNRWAFLARPHAGATDNDKVIIQPLVMAHNGVQKFGFGADGTLRINKQYTLPNMDGDLDQILQTDGNGTLSWTDLAVTSSYWQLDANGAIAHNGKVSINPTSSSTFDDPALTVQVNRANKDPLISYRNTNGIGDASVFLNSGANYWTYGLDNDLDAFKINRLTDGINNTLDDGNKTFTLLGSNGYLGLGTASPNSDLDLANEGADIRFSDSDESGLLWYEGQNEVAYLMHDNNILELKNNDTNGDIILDAVDDLHFKHNGVDKLIINEQGAVIIEDVLRLKPRSAPPSCLSVAYDGRIYYDSDDDKVYVCSDGGWKALKFE